MPDKNIILNGTIVDGFGEGAYFMSMPHYQKEIKETLGFRAYAGTLNLKVTKRQLNLLKRLEPIKIDGFKSGNKTFEGVNCYKAMIKNIEGAIIIPELTKHRNIVEFIAPIHLKSKLKIRDGHKVEVKIIK